MIGVVFAAYALKQIDAAMLVRLNAAIDRLPVHEIDSVRRLVNGTTPDEYKRIDPESLAALGSAGFATGASGWGTINYKPTKAAVAFVTLALDIRSSEAEP
jgi:hypothetical protein